MRILVLQLARFGDIYQTWPTLHALKRTHPEAEIHVLVRERFRAALDGLDFVTVQTIPSAEILEPIYTRANETAATARLAAVLDALADQRYTHVYNLSFSPFSSHVTSYLADEATTVRGYSRFADGYFNPVDDFSAYFYAQVGVGRTNRYNVTEIFAGVAGVELEDVDYRGPAPARERRGLVVHLGASDRAKAYPPERWARALGALRATSNEPITLIGSAEERALGEAVIAHAAIDGIANRAGETRLVELFDVLCGARMMIGADSGPVHVATLTATPVLNLSCAAVNFWETGPVSAGSRVLYADEVTAIDPRRIADEALAMLEGRAPTGPCAERAARGEPYRLYVMSGGDDFAWALVEALYTGSSYPVTDRSIDVVAFQRLYEVAELALDQLAQWNGPARENVAKQLGLIDDILPEIARMNRRVEPLVQWFQTQRLRMGPGSAEEILERTTRVFEELRMIASVYFTPNELDESVRRAIALGVDMAPSLREFDFAHVEGQFNELIAVLQDLARRSTNVETGGTASGWSHLVSLLGDALAARDFIELADRLEFELPRELQTLVPDVLL